MHDGPRVPQELSDLIISHLEDSKSALAACSLVSRAWTVTSQRLLFQSITLKVHRPRHRAVGRHDPITYIHEFVHFVSEDCPHLRSWVFDVSIRYTGILDAGNQRPILPIPLIEGLLSSLPHLRSLSLTSFDLLLDRHTPSSPSANAEKTRLGRLLLLDNITVESATISTIEPSSARPFLALLHLFSHIDNLYVSQFYGDWWNTYDLTLPDSNSSGNIPPTTVNRLCIQHVRDMDLLLEIFGRSLDLSSVTDFAFTITDIQDLYAIAIFVSDARTRIVNLELDLVDYSGSDEWIQMSSDAFRWMESLTMHIKVHKELIYNQMISDTILVALSRIKDDNPDPSPLSSFSIFVYPEIADYKTQLLEYIEWGSISEALEGFDHLGQVSIGVREIDDGWVSRSDDVTVEESSGEEWNECRNKLKLEFVRLGPKVTVDVESERRAYWKTL
ncbi:hypothetical protein K474DRAFT_458037 [Panus rudis PR-1116 ss-1]|nr:hypothetical protein K474DRAFT_458037 [Panus rudis PR-1116 ss-1]